MVQQLTPKKLKIKSNESIIYQLPSVFVPFIPVKALINLTKNTLAK